MTAAGGVTALLAGATGMTGSLLLQRLLAEPDYDQVVTLGRRAPPVRDERLEHRVGDLPGGVTVPPAQVLFCCLGTTLRQAGSQAAFRAVDLDLVVELARRAAAAGASRLMLLSSVGADPASRNFYLRTKGETERAVADLGFTRVGLVRPGMLLGPRDEWRPAESAGKLAMRCLNPLLAGPLARFRGVAAETVAAAMIGLDRSGFDGIRVVEGADIPRYAARANGGESD